MTHRLAREMVALLSRSEIRFERPDRDVGDTTALDFYLPDHETYIVVRKRYSERVAYLPTDKVVLLLQGIESIKTFKLLCHFICGRSDNHSKPE